MLVFVLSLGIAVLVGTIFHPISGLINLFVGDILITSLEPYEYRTYVLCLDVWLLTILIRPFLNIKLIKSKILVSKNNSALINFCFVVFLLYVVMRTFASSIDGGAAGFIVASFSLFTYYPALVGMLVGVIKIIIDSIKNKGIKRNVREKSLFHRIFIPFYFPSPLCLFPYQY
jgi:succinate dehydrogenase hydrophobic anchor subunit